MNIVPSRCGLCIHYWDQAPGYEGCTHPAAIRILSERRLDGRLSPPNACPLRCIHDRLNEDGICRECGADRRGFA